MVSPELLRRYPFFAGFDHDELEMLANLGESIQIAANHYLVREGETIESIYLLVHGSLAVVMELTDKSSAHALADQLVGRVRTQALVISTLEPGDVAGWSALAPPYTATSGLRTLTDCELVSFKAEELRLVFEADCRFGYRMLEKIVGIARERLHSLRLESLAQQIA